jgi:hypothetical protein
MSVTDSPTEEETRQLLYGDLDDLPTDGVSNDDSTTQATREGEMDVDDVTLLEDCPEEPSVMVSLDGFGENFALALHEFLAVLKPHTKSISSGQRDLVYSASARTRVTEEIRKVSAPLYEKMLDGLFLDRRIKFRRTEPTPSTYTNNMNLFCPCEMVHAAISMCPHFADRHVDLCQQIVVREERQQMVKELVAAGKQPEFTIPRIPADKKEEGKTPISQPTSIVEVSQPSRGGYNSQRGGRGFARGGNRGRSSSTSESDRGRGGGSRNNSRRRDRKNRDRSRSEFSRDNRDYNDNKKSVDFENPRSQDNRGRSNFKKPYQPAQDRLKEERRKMEEPDNRQKAEERAENSRKIAKNLAKQLGKAAASSTSQSPSVEERSGPSALDAKGHIDYSTVPRVTAPEGMKAVITLKGSYWDVQFVSKE